MPEEISKINIFIYGVGIYIFLGEQIVNNFSDTQGLCMILSHILFQNEIVLFKVLCLNIIILFSISFFMQKKKNCL